MVRKTSLVHWWKVYWVGELIMECFPTGIFSDWKLYHWQVFYRKFFWPETLPLETFPKSDRMSDFNTWNFFTINFSDWETFLLECFPAGIISYRNVFLQECLLAGMFYCRNNYWQEILLTGIITAGNFSAGNFTDWKVYRWKYYHVPFKTYVVPKRNFLLWLSGNRYI